MAFLLTGFPSTSAAELPPQGLLIICGRKGGSGNTAHVSACAVGVCGGELLYMTRRFHSNVVRLG